MLEREDRKKFVNLARILDFGTVYNLVAATSFLVNFITLGIPVRRSVWKSNVPERTETSLVSSMH